MYNYTKTSTAILPESLVFNEETQENKAKTLEFSKVITPQSPVIASAAKRRVAIHKKSRTGRGGKAPAHQPRFC